MPFEIYGESFIDNISLNTISSGCTLMSVCISILKIHESIPDGEITETGVGQQL